MHSKLTVTPVSAFRDNYIWLVHAPCNPRQVFAVDPGDAAPVLQALEINGLELAGVLATHHHWDHVGGVGTLTARRAIPVYGPARERIDTLTHRLHEGDRVELPELGLSFEVWEIPGHTAGHIAYVGEGAVFCGDTLFSAGCGRLFEGTAAQMYTSLQRFTGLAPETAVYCGHEYTVSNLQFASTVEPANTDTREYLARSMQLRAESAITLPSTIAQEFKVNPFLRCEQQSVKQAAEQHAGRELTSRTEIFAVVRQWKDGFRA